MPSYHLKHGAKSVGLFQTAEDAWDYAETLRNTDAYYPFELFTVVEIKHFTKEK